MIQTLSDALAAKGYDTLTPVQEAVTNPELAQADLLVSAQTGSGKTVGFGLAIAETLLGDQTHFDRAAAPLALIIAPTRELAMQVSRELSWLYGLAGARVTSCVGGMDMRSERRALEQGAHIVVATPGRLRDHITRASIDLSEIRAVVLDEADEMLDLGFREDLEFILEAAPEERRTLMFSATVPSTIATLAQTYQRDAVRVTTVSDSKQHADITYRAMAVAPHDAENAVINVLRFYDAENAIVFCNTRAMVNRMTTRLTNRGFSVVALSGELSQTERSHALQAMRDGRARVCVATDVAARGIDLPNLELVVHGELPTSSDTLLHRSGRTGRAGRKGVSALIVPVRWRKKAERLLQWAKLTADWVPAPSAADVQAADEARMLADPMWHDPVTEEEAPMVEKLVDAFGAQALAAAYLRLYYQRHSAPEELTDPDSRPERPERAERKAFGPSTWFSLSTGRKSGAEPRRLLPMICKAGGLTKDDIGAIRIQFDESFVEVKESSVAGFLKALDGATTLEDGVEIAQLSAPPALDERGPPARPPRPTPVARAHSDEDGIRPKSRWQPDDNAIAQPAPSPKPAYRPSHDRPAPRPQPVNDSTWAKSDEKAPRKPSGKPSAKPAGKAYAKSDAKPDRKAYGKPVAGAEKKPWGKPEGKPERKPYGKPGDSAEKKPWGKPEGKPDRKPYGKPGEGAEKKPYGKPGAKPGGKPFGKPGEAAGAKPFVKGKGKPGGKPAPAPARASDTSKRFVPPKAKG